MQLTLAQNRLILNDGAVDEHNFPLEDLAAVIAVSFQGTLSLPLLSALAEHKVPLLVCDARYRPASFTLPCHQATSTATLRRQVNLNATWKTRVFRLLIQAKLRAQARCLLVLEEDPGFLPALAERLADEKARAAESRGARYYWPRYLAACETAERRRTPGCGSGANGRLDYGYAVLRALILRSLYVHGLIPALGVGHAAKAGSFALADDLIEPLRPMIDLAQWQFCRQQAPVEDEAAAFRAWARAAAACCVQKVLSKRKVTDLLHGVDRMVQSFCRAMGERLPSSLELPEFLPQTAPLLPASSVPKASRTARRR